MCTILKPEVTTCPWSAEKIPNRKYLSAGFCFQKACASGRTTEDIQAILISCFRNTIAAYSWMAASGISILAAGMLCFRKPILITGSPSLRRILRETSVTINFSRTPDGMWSSSGNANWRKIKSRKHLILCTPELFPAIDFCSAHSAFKIRKPDWRILMMKLI